MSSQPLIDTTIPSPGTRVRAILLGIASTCVCSLGLSALPSLAGAPDLFGGTAHAQDEGEETEEDYELGDSEDDLTLREPVAEPPEIDWPEEEEEIEEDENPVPVPVDPSQLQNAGGEESGDDDAARPSSDPSLGWRSPASTFTLHGYFRVRGELQDRFFLGRSQLTSSGVPFADNMPFERFRPIDRNAAVAGGCSGGVETDMSLASRCSASAKRLRFANMRLRLEPTIALSDDVQLHLQFDVFDNMVLGSTPNSNLWSVGPGGYARNPNSPGAQIDSLANSQYGSGGRNDISDSIRVRRAWAEVTNQGLGQLRFGRMGSHWGLGLLNHGGDGLDQDFQTDVDRIMAITRLAGFYFAAGWDFANEGFIRYDQSNPYQIPYDATQRDDINQFVFSAARRMEEEEQADRLADGGWVLNAGLWFQFRKQSLSAAGISDPFADPEDAGSLLGRRRARLFMPDIWAQFLWGDLRLEFEAAMVVGSVGNAQADPTVVQADNYDFLQFGAALEAEYRLLDDKLGIYLYTGFATGDSDVAGISMYNNLIDQSPGSRNDDRVSTFAFHPAYRVDLILFRQILGTIAGAYYFRPGVSYDIIRDSFGQRLGARFDLIYSRASRPVQTYGSDPNLGVEMNLSVYYRSDDGPDLLDGFYAQFQYGLLFPLDGLGYPTFNDVQPDTVDGRTSIGRAQTLRLLLGVEF